MGPNALTGARWFVLQTAGSIVAVVAGISLIWLEDRISDAADRMH